jgi:hypothetical protein
MILNHVAAILLFSGPLFYVGLLMAVDPAGVATVPQRLFGFIRSVRNEETAAPELSDVSRPIRRALRIAGVALVLIAILF